MGLVPGRHRHVDRRHAPLHGQQPGGSADAAADQQRLLEEQQARLEAEAEALALRRRYVALKIAYWQAVRDGDTSGSEQVAAQARALADELRAVTRA